MLQTILVAQIVDLHAVLMVLAETAGGSLLGIVGAFFAVPVVAVASAVLRYGRERLDDPRPPRAPATLPAAPAAGSGS